jgi:hypothetical protein
MRAKPFSNISAIYPPIIPSKLGSMKPPGSISPALPPKVEPSQEIIRKRPSLFGASDSERAHQMAQEVKLAGFLSGKKPAASETPPEEIKKNRPPDFDDDAVKWMGRTI